ncbi:uncharacterized protein LOC124885779 [Capsicum annuum]|uniref:uncharacterized protein LOC124885779 n=1 Tax=Capsicum annuum TaxID=4072 RepID=UPI001FB0E780|nr:uncharacterized protein LOC124885779 [Capsicum annuum]
MLKKCVGDPFLVVPIKNITISSSLSFELIGNLKTHELKTQQELEKKDFKREKYLALKASKHDSSEEESDIAYLASRIVKSMKKSGHVQRRRSNNNKGSNVDVCHKCESPEHFINDCPIHKMVHQDYLKAESDKGNIRDQIPDNS